MNQAKSNLLDSLCRLAEDYADLHYEQNDDGSLQFPIQEFREIAERKLEDFLAAREHPPALGDRDLRRELLTMMRPEPWVPGTTMKINFDPAQAMLQRAYRQAEVVNCNAADTFAFMALVMAQAYKDLWERYLAADLHRAVPATMHLWQSGATGQDRTGACEGGSLVPSHLATVANTKSGPGSE